MVQDAESLSKVSGLCFIALTHEKKPIKAQSNLSASFSKQQE